MPRTGLGNRIHRLPSLVHGKKCGEKHGNQIYTITQKQLRICIRQTQASLRSTLPPSKERGWNFSCQTHSTQAYQLYEEAFGVSKPDEVTEPLYRRTSFTTFST